MVRFDPAEVNAFLRYTRYGGRSRIMCRRALKCIAVFTIIWYKYGPKNEREWIRYNTHLRQIKTRYFNNFMHIILCTYYTMTRAPARFKSILAQRNGSTGIHILLYYVSLYTIWSVKKSNNYSVCRSVFLHLNRKHFGIDEIGNRYYLKSIWVHWIGITFNVYGFYVIFGN